MPVYIVKSPTTANFERLVEAPNQASARNHVARSILRVEVARGADLFRLAKSGVELETVNADQAIANASEGMPSAGEDGENVERTTDDAVAFETSKVGKAK